MSDPLANALEMRAALKRRLIEVEAFIENYRVFANGDMPLPTKRRRATVSGRPAQAWQAIEAALQASERPLTRPEIVSACAAAGYEMPGENKVNYVGIILHRNPGRVVKVGKGFSLRGLA